MATNIWEGTTSSDVDDGTNWSLEHKPTTDEDVIIAYVTTNDPVTTGDFAIDGSLNIEDGGFLTVSPGDTLSFTEDNNEFIIESGGYFKLDGEDGNEATLDFGSLADFTMDIEGYFESNYGIIDNMNNAIPIDIEDGWIMMWNSEIISDVTWRVYGCARMIQLIRTTVTNYGNPTLTSGSYVFTFNTKYSRIEISEDDVTASSGIIKSTGKSLRMGKEPKVVTIDGACLNAAGDKIEELRSLSVEQFDLSYKKYTFMCGDEPQHAIAGFIKMGSRVLEKALYPKFYKLTIEESRY